ncbi:hypothetical protein HMP0721_1761 [Pseudoramibacter alactolyticus ATCC 23263]|uniref:Uncharacterized protein n=1 Tax=Pseudoramibacter alactolyticus ATCC 23263 TaxID=887929 RepID=E6MIC6_9FIRM|nr:hypothetical protein HMP0721_1761 [Pseudoramibacter alactolyticus ATCC 23263]
MDRVSAGHRPHGCHPAVFAKFYLFLAYFYLFLVFFIQNP